MKPLLAALLSGFTFGAGLVVSGMTRPDKVIAFLDLADGWDPSLAFVMGGAIGVHLLLFRFILKQDSPLFAERFGIPTRSDIDGRLVLGAGTFGVGWALGGYCPGPALTSLTSFAPHVLVFVAMLIVGITLQRALDAALERSRRTHDAVAAER